VTVVDILCSDEYSTLRGRLDGAIRRLTCGLDELDLVVMGGATPIVSVLIGDESDTLNAGKCLFDRGYYVQSVLFPAVPYHAGVLRIQCNANHSHESIDGLIEAFGVLSARMRLPQRKTSSRESGAGKSPCSTNHVARITEHVSMA
jgi:7-keto-8-aminopelargonate synthetase-like enzyme